MSTHPFCPSCGADVTAQEPIFLNGWTMIDDAYPISYQGKTLQLSAAESTICWTLLKAYPRGVKVDTLLNRFDSEGCSNVLQSLVSRIRRKCRERGFPNPIETMGNKLYRWNTKLTKKDPAETGSETVVPIRPLSSLAGQ